MKTARPIAPLLLLTAALMFGHAGLVVAASEADLLAQAEAHYAEGEYAQAVQLYQQLVQRYPDDAALLYNLGTALAKAGDSGRAIWRFLQARQIAPRDRSIQHNLTVLMPDHAQELAPTPIPPLNSLYFQFSANEWAAGAVGGTLAAFLLGSLYFSVAARRPGLAQAARRLAFCCGALAILFWPPALMRYCDESLNWRGVVVEPGTQLRTNPSESGGTVTHELPPGSVLEIRNNRDGWLSISYRGGRKGFVQRDRIEFL